MNAAFRSSLFKLLDKLPSKLGYFIYHQLQRLTPEDISKKVKANQHSYDVIQRIIQSTGLNLTGSKIIEIGSGWMPLMPYLLHYQGGRKRNFYI